jgi:hypothetical protein
VVEVSNANLVDFGVVPEAVNPILQEGVALYRHDQPAAEARFRAALVLDPTALPTYLCLYKIHTYQGRLDDALVIARAGIEEAARQAGIAPDWTQWTRAELNAAVPDPARFALYTLKALSFIHLRRNERGESERCLAKLADLGELDSVGGTVIADLARALS